MNITSYKIDLHTHSIISYDGGITAEQYKKILDRGALDCIAITDHNETSFARVLHEKLGEKIIVGEEITTTDGEMLGLFLTQTIPPGLSAEETAAAIHEQGGLVCIPHPFETFRKGIKRSVLEKLQKEIDMIEVFNARARLRGKPIEAQVFASSAGIAKVSNSDAHGYHGVGTAYTTCTKFPTAHNLKKLVAEGMLQERYAPLWTYLYPSVNKIKNKIVLTQ